MVHHDIKPQNLMVNARGQVKVLDFGLTRMRSERKAGGGLTQADAFMGTPEYISPEQATDARSVDTRADIYSLGCTLFFLLTGRPPFQGDTAVKLILAHIEKEPPALQEVRPDVPAELSAVVARMLAKDPTQRFQTPLEVAQELTVFVKAGTKWAAAGVSSSAPAVASPGTGTVIAADTSKIKAILSDAREKTPAKKAQAGAAPAPDSTRPAAAPPVRPAQTLPKRSSSHRLPLAVAVALLLVLGLGAVIVIRLSGGQGTVTIETVDPDVEVAVKKGGQEVVILDPKTKQEVTLKAGAYEVDFKKGGEGLKLEARNFTLKRGDKVVVKVTGTNRGVSAPDIAQPPIDPDWIKQVAAVPVDLQAVFVATRLKQLNPGYDGQVTSKVENGQVTELQVVTDLVPDISPVRGLTGLKKLVCKGSAPGKGRLGDLSPLEGLPLKEIAGDFKVGRDLDILRSIKTLERINDQPAVDFWKDWEPRQTAWQKWLQTVPTLPPDVQVTAVAAKLKELNPSFDGKVESKIDHGAVTELSLGTNEVTDISPLRALKKLQKLGCSSLAGVPFAGKVWDLSPLQGMPLTELNCGDTQVLALSPLQGLPLVRLSCYRTPVRSLAPVKSLPLTSLQCWEAGISDLSPLKGMQLTELNCGGNAISDLAPLQGMPLVSLSIYFTPVKDLSLLRGMQLTHFNFRDTHVADLTPLEGMPLKTLNFGAGPGWPSFGKTFAQGGVAMKRDVEILHSFKTLEQINGKPASQFLEEVSRNPGHPWEVPPQP